MPKLIDSAPKYRKHKPSGQAVVTIAGKDFYLGPHGSRSSRRLYDRLVGEWMVGGRVDPANDPEAPPVTITEIAVDYLKKAKTYYVKNGEHTSEYTSARVVLKDLRALYGSTLAVNFGPIAYKAFRERLKARGLTRQTINRYLIHVLAAFRLAVENEKIDVSVWQSLKAVERLRKGRTDAKECKRIPPADPAIVDATLPHLPPIIADMVRLQGATAMRPNEVCNVRPIDVDRSGEIWIYIPFTHKTEHHGRPRIVPLGPEAQRILAPYLLRSPTSFCFSPAEAMEQHRRRRHLKRTTRLSCGNRPGSNRKRKPKRSPTDRYTSGSYARRIAEICLRHSLPHWTPNQLRKLAATRFRKIADLEAAQVILGHSSKAVTEAYYADPDIGAAVEAARKIG